MRVTTKKIALMVAALAVLLSNSVIRVSLQEAWAALNVQYGPTRVTRPSLSANEFEQWTGSVWTNKGYGTSANTIAEGNDIRFLSADFGDGSDGAVTISTTVTLTHAMHYTTLVVANGGTLNNASYAIYGSISITVQSGGIIQNNGIDGLANNNAGRNGAASGFFIGGTKGGNGTTTTGGNGTAATGMTLGGIGGSGGAGSSGSGGSGGVSGGTPVDSAFFRTLFAREFLWAPIGTAIGTPTGYSGGTGGGGGGGNGSGSGTGGGGGGGSIVLKSPTITVNAGGIIQANGGAGAVANIVGNNGAGGGGGGGVISLIYRSYTNSGTVQANGGNGGTALGGAGGTSGSNGGIGLILTKPLQ